jgi:glycosyltransferase involved in cell wall biosynthesis
VQEFRSVSKAGVPAMTTALKPYISVILCTQDRDASLTRCLDYYSRIIPSDVWELIVVDNGSVDRTSEVLELEVQHQRLPLVFVKEGNKGLSKARNAGIRRARGEIICFSDDDCYPDAQFIAAWKRVFEDPKVGFAGGRIELFDPADAKVTIKTDADPQFFLPNDFIFPGTLHGASMAFRRAVVDTVGVFDDDLGAGTSVGSGEDSDYFQRASENGFIGFYSPEPLVWHHHGRKDSEIKRLYPGYDRGRGAFYAAILARNPRVLTKAILDDFYSRKSLKSYVGQLYWRHKDRPIERMWNVSCGALRYWATKFGIRDGK